MKVLFIDIETFSKTDLTKVGVYRYAKDPSTEILLLSYSEDYGEVVTYDLLSGERPPEEFWKALEDPTVEKHAYNAAFERILFSAYLGRNLDPSQWRCTMVHALYLGFPAALAQVGEVLGITKKKLESGKELIKVFSMPVKPTKSNGMKVRNLPTDSAEYKKLYDDFAVYNARDVDAEIEIAKKLSRFPVPDSVWQEYALDQRINDLGVALDMELVNSALTCDETFHEKYLSRAQELTGLENPNSPLQLREWLDSQGVHMETMTKGEVKKVLEEVSGDAKEVLELRQLLAKSSTKKYEAMAACVCPDGRAHGLLQFYGANRTGRWAGRLVQVQNLPQNHIPDLALCRSLIRDGRFDDVELLYDSIPDSLSQLIRTAFVPKEGCKFMVADYSAVEARALSWMAGETWRQEVFAKDGDIYSESATKMFGVPVSKHGPNSELRQKGKIAELALGYGGGTGAMISMGALEQGLEEAELQGIVDSWRSANSKIVSLWWEIDKAVITCLKEKKVTTVKCISFSYASGILFMHLPSGRTLSYVRPKLFTNEYGRDEVSYEGLGSNKRWENNIASYGPKFCENAIQAICRDILAEAMIRLDKAGYKIVMHVHDECVIEAPMDASLEDACRIMGETPSWADGLLLTAAGYECPFYQKD